jgi:L-alanine-DL-glutamate epimerase-like enolase superfamily enzyme
MADAARAFRQARAIKLKLTGEPIDADRVRAVHEARPDVWLCVDANQGFSRRSFEALMPVLVASGVRLIEQPFPADQDVWLDGLQSPIPIAADESLQVAADVPRLVGRFNVGNIKLDKCGGLTGGLAVASALRHHGLDVMVGSMGGTSLAMAPAFIVGQLAQFVDLDGAALIATDRPDTVRYQDGCIMWSETLWGSR